MRLPRPYIPLSVRIDVVYRQLCLLSPHRVTIDTTKSERTILKRLLEAMFGDETVHLDHDPPLGAREKVYGVVKGVVDVIRYIPDANDPEHLVYRTETLHKLKTNVRGEHGQHPDRVLIKKQRRLERQTKKSHKGTKRLKRVSRRSGSRKIQSRVNPWPKGRKFQRRRTNA